MRDERFTGLPSQEAPLRRGDGVPNVTTQTADETHLAASMSTAPMLLLRPVEAARTLGVGRSTLYELMRAGEIPVVHIGRAVRVPMRALEKWVEQRATSHWSP